MLGLQTFSAEVLRLDQACTEVLLIGGHTFLYSCIVRKNRKVARYVAEHFEMGDIFRMGTAHWRNLVVQVTGQGA